MSNFVTYRYEEHLISQQKTKEEVFLKAFEDASPKLDDAHVVVNPYIVNPLAAVILFKTDSKESPTMTIHGKRHSREDIVKTFTAGTSHVIPVIGLYEGIETKVTIKLSNTSKTFAIKAGELPKDICRCQNIMTSIDYFGTDLMLLTPAGKNFAVGYDYRGEIRWAMTTPTMFDIKRLKNGNILTGSHRYSRMPYNATGLIEMSLTGKIIKEYRMPGNYHHDQVELADGNIMALTQSFAEGSNTVEDMIALLDRNTGMVLRTWDYKDFLPQNVGGSGSQDPHDWFHNNALWVDEKNKTVTISGRHQDAVVNFSYEENGGKGKLNWIIGNPDGWPEDMQKYFFKPVGDTKNFDWQYEQHACLLTPNGDVMAFDNGQFRAKVKDKYIKNRDNFSRGVRYRIDTNKMEIEQVWQFGKEWGQDFFSPYICNVEFYAEGHYMIHSGGIGFLDGYAPDGLPPFIALNKEVVSGEQHFEMRSKTVEEKDGVVRYFLETEGNFYRAERLSIYHDGENLPLGAGQLIGELDITPEFGTIPDVEEVMQVAPLDYQIDIVEEEDKLVLAGLFPRGSLAMWVLEGKDSSHGYYINTAAQNFLAMCSAAYLEANADTNRFSLSKRGLSGKYEIKVVINDKKYQTGISFFC